MAIGRPRSLVHLAGLGAAVLLTLLLLHFSRFWIWVGPWSPDGLLGLGVLSPYGNMVSWWLRGTWAQDFDLVIWGCGGFVLLSLVQWIAGKVSW